MKSFFTFAAAVALVAITAANPQAESSPTRSLTLLSPIPNSAQAPTGTVTTESQPKCQTVTVSSAPTLRGTTTLVSSTHVSTTFVPISSASEQFSTLPSNNSLVPPGLVGRQNPTTSAVAVSSVISSAIPSSSAGNPTVSSVVTASPPACTVTVVLDASGPIASSEVASGITSSTTNPNVVTRITTRAHSSPSSPGASGTSSLFNSASSLDVRVEGILMTLLASLVIAML